jgi:alpha-mannosidase
MTPPIGTDGDPVAMERQRLAWQRRSGCPDVLWLPGVGDHGGGPTAAMLEQLALWQGHPAAAAQRHGSLRSHLRQLEPLAAGLPVWRDELYLELHRGCPTSRPDQKRHNRTLERLLREAELAVALGGSTQTGTGPRERGGEAIDWRPLLFQQFHDILPGTSIPEVFEQAGATWRRARRQTRRQRDRALGGGAEGRSRRRWRVAQLQPLPATARTLRLPAGAWSLCQAPGDPHPQPLPCQPAAGGGCWVQLPGIRGADVLELERRSPAEAAGRGDAEATAALRHPVRLEPDGERGPGHWRLGNGLLTAAIGPAGVEQLWDREGRPALAGPLEWRRWRDAGEYWDAWDIAGDYRNRPLPWHWQGAPEWIERGPLCGRCRWRGRCGASPLRLDGRLLAGSDWLELVLHVNWRQRHELLRLEVPLAQRADRWAADAPGAVLERPARPRTAREQARWEVPAIAWVASVGGAGGLAALLDGPQGVSGGEDRLGVSLLRGPTWPDPGADNGHQRLRLALLPCPQGWRSAAVPLQARRFREPLWCRPLADGETPAWRPFPALAEDLALVALRRAGDGSGDVILGIQNEGPCRRRLDPGERWRLVGRLADALEETPGAADTDLAPWQLGFWRLRWRGEGARDQSS